MTFVGTGPAGRNAISARPGNSALTPSGRHWTGFGETLDKRDLDCDN
ncbi:hypothetical protein ACFOY4_43425 [Actinomadura syzygii]|nr:hypothetical protein [Actinomadura syzygii]